MSSFSNMTDLPIVPAGEDRPRVTAAEADVVGREPGQYQSCPQRGQVFSTE
jgi:hypothetical protein